jgi:hypothetical protein
MDNNRDPLNPAFVTLVDLIGEAITSFGSGVAGELLSAVCVVPTDTAPSTATTDYCDFGALGADSFKIESVRLQANLAAAVACPNLRVRWCIAESAAAADAILVAEANIVKTGVASSVQQGFFDLTVQCPGASTYNVSMKEPEYIDVSTPQRYLFFRHAMGTTCEIAVSGIRKI